MTSKMLDGKKFVKLDFDKLLQVARILVKTQQPPFATPTQSNMGAAVKVAVAKIRSVRDAERLRLLADAGCQEALLKRARWDIRGVLDKVLTLPDVVAVEAEGFQFVVACSNPKSAVWTQLSSESMASLAKLSELCM